MTRTRVRKPTAADASNFTAGVEDEQQPPAAAVLGDLPGHGEGAQPTPNPAFVMSDDPAVPSQFLRQPPSHEAAQEKPAPMSDPLVPSGAGPAAPTIYEHRIRVLEAFHYAGTLANAPDWIRRDWVAYADWDEATKRPAGPALLVPTPRTPTGSTLCRKGDYVVRQEIILAHGAPPDEQIEVWEQGAFERLFIPAATITVTERHRVDEEAAP